MAMQPPAARPPRNSSRHPDGGAGAGAAHADAAPAKPPVPLFDPPVLPYSNGGGSASASASAASAPADAKAAGGGGASDAPVKVYAGGARDTGRDVVSGDYAPVSWSGYFDSADDIAVPTAGGSGDTFRVYRAGSGKAPAVFVLIHGAGHSGLSWALCARELKKDYDVVAYDQRAHGFTKTADEKNLVRRCAARVLCCVTSLCRCH
jgi:hypothetical protein